MQQPVRETSQIHTLEMERSSLTLFQTQKKGLINLLLENNDNNKYFLHGKKAL